MSLLPEIFLQRVRDSAERDAFGQRGVGGWTWASWGETGERAMALAAALLAAGFRKGTVVAVLSTSRREWIEVEAGVLMAGGVVVPIHPGTTPAAAQDIVRRAGARWAFVEEPLQAEKLLPAMEPAGPLGRVVAFDSLSRLPGADALGRLEIALADVAAGASGLLSHVELLESGRHELRRGAEAVVRKCLAELSPDDPATIVFNWSAAGRPLATVLSHDNISFTTAGVPRELGVTAQDRTLLFLPLAHVYPRLVVWMAMHVGFAVGFAPARGEALRAAAEMRPDFLIVVPRFLERLRRGLEQEMDRGPFWLRGGMRWAFDIGRERNEALADGRVPFALDLQHRVADRLFHMALRERLGGRLRFIICGGAPLDRETERYFGAVGIPVLEGYGMTEGTGLTTFQRPARPRPGTVGTPLGGMQLRLATDGEILFRGRNVMLGYLDDPDATAEIKDPDGWIRSGDLGTLDADGFLAITGRKKDIIVTEGGKNVSPLHIEQLLRGDPIVRDVLVVGDRRPHLVALVVPEEKEVSRTVLLEGILLTSREEAAAHPAIRAKLDAAVAATNARLDPFLQLRAYAVVPDLDAAGKSGRARRQALVERYKDVIARLYVRR
ncbi:MAG: AMP-binding protein [Deltaproteobacteria bacterium]|nr:AMP-binding protein [Deltaproteobacteria bacterium]